MTDRLNILSEAFNEARDLAATIGIRFDSQSDLSSSTRLPSDLDSISTASRGIHVRQPMSMHSEYLSGQVAEGQAIIEALDRRFPALKTLVVSLEERIQRSTAGVLSDLCRDPLDMSATEVDAACE